MTFEESLEYLLSLGFELSVKKFGLENTTILLDALGNPQINFIKVQIAGTNGKGSTCAFLESICKESGVRVGLNTSPHLVSITERVRVGGEDISENDFARLATKVRSVSEDLVASGVLQALPTYFEHVTAIAQLAFVENNVEVAILETGLGGRFDATTATNAEIVALTPIALDHVKTLGPTIVDIAGEKAAIIRSDTQVFSVRQIDAVEDVILQRCAEKGVTPVWTVVEVALLDEGIAEIRTSKSVYESAIGLPGKHQWTNATLAIYLAEALQDRGFGITNTGIENGIRNARHAGRLEYSDGILYDGAHNVAGAEVLREYLSETIKQPITMIYGSSSGKDIGQVAGLLFPMADNLILTTSENPRAVPASEFAEIGSKHVVHEKLHVVKGVAHALELGKRLAGDNVLLVTGSLYLIGEVKAILRDREVERRKKK